ncbi:porin family protein [Robiginitalea sp. SC105]|uniref:porin family protein n=1 Tax=Robiginitalea sp. SC105 TaxID=2762332 RepID=UPI00163A1AD2|nr:porin family protein [Robiginitalea sp. SC105]MBC2840128.1 PorT family protein [Robiginitalea sp. SC105]
MKRTLLCCLLAFFSLAAFSQKDPGFGIKAGLNFNSNGDYKFDSAPDLNSDTKMGYHLGVFGQIGDKWFFRPELIYTKTKSEYDGADFDMSKLDLPLLVGVRILGIAKVFAGPDLQYILNTDFDQITLGDVENDFTIGLHIGAGVDLGNIGIDLRYERGLSSNEAEFVNLPDQRLDTRPSQFILGLSVKL